MAVQLVGTEYTVTASAVPLSTVLGVTGSGRFLSHATFRAGDANVGTVYIGKSNVTVGANRLVYLEVNESFSFGMEGCYTNAEDWYIIGTAGDILHIVCLT